MPLEYGLVRRVLGSPHFVPISEAEYAATAEAKAALMTLLGMEEKLNFLLENYVEFEHELLQITLQHALYAPEGWSTFVTAIHQVNRRLVNLLSSTRLYLDQIRHDVRTLPGVGEEDAAEILARPSKEFDSRLGYRAMEALRNHVQHRGLPLHSISSGSQWRETPSGERRVNHAALYLDVETLREDPYFRRATLEDLTAVARDGKVLMKPLVREYITGLLAVQLHARTVLQAYTGQWDEQIGRMIDQYNTEVGGNLLGLYAVGRSPEGEYRYQVALFMDFVERRRWLERKNRGAGELANLVISSE